MSVRGRCRAAAAVTGMGDTEGPRPAEETREGEGVLEARARGLGRAGTPEKGSRFIGSAHVL